MQGNWGFTGDPKHRSATVNLVSECDIRVYEVTHRRKWCKDCDTLGLNVTESKRCTPAGTSGTIIVFSVYKLSVKLGDVCASGDSLRRSNTTPKNEQLERRIPDRL